MILIAFFLCLNVKALAKAIELISINGVGCVSKPIFDVQKENSFTINKLENKNYKFKIINYKDEEISNVDIQYYIKINTELEKSYYKMLKNGTEIEIEKNATKLYLMEKEKKQEDIYEIQILLDNNLKYVQIQDNIQIQIFSEQKN